MLDFRGAPRAFCDGVRRRDFLRIGALALGGLSLPELLQAESRSPRANQHKSIIMVYLPGGPSHLDMYDLKPDAPSEYRGEFNPISTNVSGIDISEYFPQQAKIADKLAIVRSVVGAVSEHAPALLLSGYGEAVGKQQGGRPSLGAILSRLQGPVVDAVPPFVSLMGKPLGMGGGYAGAQHDPFTPDGPGLQNLTLTAGVTLDRLQDRRRLLTEFDRFRRDADASGAMEGLDGFTARALEIVTSTQTRDALDLNLEAPEVRARYGEATQFLTARRLVQAGVRCVTLAFGGWDTHGDNFNHLRRQLPQLDQAFAALVTDLHELGLADDCSVVMWGEFGRTPRVNGAAGRDHWEPVMSAALAGGGLQTGQVVGSTSARGETAQDRPVTVQQLLATLYQAVGIDPGTYIPDHRGRPMHLLDDRQPVAELA